MPGTKTSIKLVYVSKNEKHDIAEIILKLKSFYPTISNLAHTTRFFSVREYATLYYDLDVFYNTDVCVRHQVSINDIKSFRNSFSFLYQKCSSKIPGNESGFRLFLYSAYLFFHYWYTRCEKQFEVDFD